MAALGGYYGCGYQPGSRTLASKRWVAHLLLGTTFAYVLFEERFTIGVSTGGRGALQPFDFFVPLVGIFMFLGAGGISGPRLLHFDPRGLFWIPYLGLTTALPILGVFIASEAPRTMYTSIHGVIAISLMLFGAWGAFTLPSVRKLAQYYVWFAIIFEFVIALVDYLNKTGMYPTALGKFLLQWNFESEGALSEFTIITWRSVGTFINPNDLGFWSVVAFWISALLLRGMFRFTGIIGALLTEVLSQSRGSLISLLATFGVWLVYVALSRDGRLTKARDATYLSAIVLVLIIGWSGGLLSQSNGVSVSDKFNVVDRFERGLDVLTEGAGADSNASARVNAWHLAMAYYSNHPLGTWVSPRLKFHLYIDNEYVRTLMQGSVPYLFALLLIIACSLRRITRPAAVPRLTAMIAVTAAVNGMSAYPFEYSAMGLFWVLLGYDLADERLQKEALTRESRRLFDTESMIAKSTNSMPTPRSPIQLQPMVFWATPEPIVYGTRLSSVQLNAAASVPGKFTYTPGPGYVLPAGTHTLWATFYAAGLGGEPVLAEASITVSKAAPCLYWPTPAQMPPGVALGTSQLNASADVPGIFEYSPAPGEVLAEGTHTLSVTFVPDDEANYTSVQATVSVVVAKTVPNIQWASPNPIPCGTPLGAAQLNASASIPGTFEYSPAAGEVLSAGSHTLAVVFIPSDGTVYSRAKATVPLAVTRATPAVVWPTPEKIPYGTLLSDSQLNATASVPGTFVYTPRPGTLLSAGEHTPSVVFTPSNLSDYAPVQAAVSLSVIKKAPAIHWPTPGPIIRATPLGPDQLNASASVEGNFTYNPAAGETLGPGTHTLAASFTPADSVNYTSAEASVSLTVVEIVPANITWRDPPPISYGTELSPEQLNATSSIPGSFIYAPAAGEVLPAGKHKLSVIFTPDDEEKHTRVQASVTLIVEELPNVGSLLRASVQNSLDQGMTPQPAADGTAEPTIVRKDDQPAKDLQGETRLYRGAVYAKGNDGQWHLQRK